MTAKVSKYCLARFRAEKGKTDMATLQPPTRVRMIAAWSELCDRWPGEYTKPRAPIGIDYSQR